MFARANSNDDTLTVLFWAIAVIALAFYFRRRSPRTEFGYQQWATDKLLKSWHMLGNHGLILGRTLGGAMIRLPSYTHLLLIGTPGSGKSVGILISNLLTYHRGSIICFDKGDLHEASGAVRQASGERVVRLCPFGEGGERWNPLDLCRDEMLIEDAGSIAEALIVKEEGSTADPHWNQKAAAVIKAILVLVLTKMGERERNLNSVAEIACDPLMIAAAGEELRKLGGIPARLGNTLRGLFEPGGGVSKEGSGILSTVARHLEFLNSPKVVVSVSESTWDARSILEPGTTLFLQIGGEHLESAKGLLRCWVSTLARMIGSEGSERSAEVLLLLDEASALSGLIPVKEMLVRGRSAGGRCLLAFQSFSQARAFFPAEPTLIEDTCGIHIQMGPPASYEGAEVLSKALGEWTQEVRSSGRSWSWSPGEDGRPGKYSSSGSTNDAPQAHPLLRPSECLRLGQEYLIALVRGFPSPIFARRIEWFCDPAFVGVSKSPKRWSRRTVVIVVWAALMFALCSLCALSRAGCMDDW
jgi:type IV secretion system protein VirD4